MDDATENLDIVPDIADSEKSEALLSAENLNLDNSAEFNLDDVLNSSGADSSEALLNLAEEGESTADLNMEDWLAGITPSSESPAAGDVDLPESEDIRGDIVAGISENIDGRADFSDADIEISPANADEENSMVSEEAASEAEGADEVGGWLAEDSPAEIKDMPEKGNSWLAETEEVSEPVADTEEADSSIGGGWLAETETNEAEVAAVGENESEENSVAENGWLSDEETAGETLEPEVPAVTDEENGTDGMPADESEVVTESSWLSSEGETVFEENNTDVNAEISADNGKVSGWDEVTPAAESVPGTAGNNDAAQPQGICGTEPNFVKWYSGSVHDEMFEISKNELPPEIEGNTDNNIIHINAGYDTYGWLAEFDNGLVMSLEDVRKYQIRNGALPAASGVIRYGANQCRFSNIERILIYQSVRYFSYGA